MGGASRPAEAEKGGWCAAQPPAPGLPKLPPHECLQVGHEHDVTAAVTRAGGRVGTAHTAWSACGTAWLILSCRAFTEHTCASQGASTETRGTGVGSDKDTDRPVPPLRHLPGDGPAVQSRVWLTSPREGSASGIDGNSQVGVSHNASS